MACSTKEKVEAKIDQLLSRFAKIDARIRSYEEQHRVLGGEFGSGIELAEMQDVNSGLHSALTIAKTEIQNGKTSPDEIAPKLKAVANESENFRRILDQMDVASARGSAKFKARFGG